PGVDKRLVEVIRRCTQAAKTARYASAAEVGAALRSLQAPAKQGAGSGRGMLAALAGGSALAVGLWLGFGGGDANGGSGNGSRGDDPARAELTERFRASYSAEYERVRGLFIGIGDAYRGTKMSRLFNPVREVDAVAQWLRNSDPQWAAEGAIKTLRDGEARHEVILDELDRLEKTSRPEDAVLVWFAGHGVQDGHSFGLAAADVDGPIERGKNYVRRERLLNFLERCPAKHVLVVLDCCHAGAVVALEPTRDGGVLESPPGQDPEPRADGVRFRRHCSREFLCSVGAGERAPDGNRLSPFCEQFLAQLDKTAREGATFALAQHIRNAIAKEMDHGDGVRVGPVPTPEIHDIARQKGSFVFKLAKGR
ncbi:MAG: caspase family protein, partial [Planctomycetota bacterium]